MSPQASDPTDAALIAASLRDPDAFRTLYDRYALRLHRYFARRTASADVAVDLTAETFAQAWISRRRFRDLAGGSAAPWLFTIGRRVLVASVERGRLEASALERLRVDLPVVAADVRPEGAWLDGLDAELESALAALPLHHRQAVELRVVGDLPYATVARQLGCTPAAARIRVSRSLAWLRTRLEGA